MIRDNEWRRTPSLREIRASKPDNVAILPTAQPRQVAQNYNRKARAAKSELRSQTQGRFEYLHPQVRAQMSKAKRLASIAPQTARDRLIDAIILHVLTDEQRQRLLDIFASSEQQTALEAAEIVRMAEPMPIGQQYALLAALEVVAGEQ